jgi:hypothetical protein
LWSLPADLGNELLDDPPEDVPVGVFDDDEDDTNEDEQSVDDQGSVDLLAEKPNQVVPPKIKVTSIKTIKTIATLFILTLMLLHL